MPRTNPPSIPPAFMGWLHELIDARVKAALAELRATRADYEPDPWVPHTEWPCVSRRAACQLARSGAVQGVQTVGKGPGTLHLARRSALAAWIEVQNPAEPAPEDDFDREMSKRNLIVGPRKAPPRHQA
jgi:hypothetical protein